MRTELKRLLFFIVLCAGLWGVVIPSLRGQEADPGLAVEGVVENAVEAAVVPAEAQMESILEKVNGALDTALFFDVSNSRFDIPALNSDGSPILDAQGQATVKEVKVPFLIVILLCGAIFFTFWFRWINIRGFKHAFDVVRGKYDRAEDEGEISHFRALTSALSATVGLGNIAGVAVAIQAGGPGAVFWMWCAAVFGMAAKFSSCTLSQMYRQVNPDGSISGGPMYYLDLGLRNMGIGPLGKILGVMFALMVMGGAVGGGNMFQVNQTAEAIRNTFEVQPELASKMNLGIGIVMAILVGAVILGGIKRIGATTSRIVPFMVGIYVVASIYVIVVNAGKVPETFGLIFKMAFSENALYGGFVGVLVMGIQRAAFSNEAGLGSAAIAHAAAKTDEPVREGIVAMMGPFIDTIVVCTMTALVVIITGAWSNPELVAQGGNIGVTLTTEAFGSAISWFPYVLTGCICLFAYSTMISWCYYGERGWIYLLDHAGKGVGLKSVIVFRLVFVGLIIAGAINPLSNVLTFSDIMILSMAFPNIVGSVILAPRVLAQLREYWGRYKSGGMEPVA